MDIGIVFLVERGATIVSFNQKDFSKSKILLLQERKGGTE